MQKHLLDFDFESSSVVYFYPFFTVTPVIVMCTYGACVCKDFITLFTYVMNAIFLFIVG